MIKRPVLFLMGRCVLDAKMLRYGLRRIASVAVLVLIKHLQNILLVL